MNRFEQTKRDLFAENEQKYGEEIREKYGEPEVDASNAKLMNMSEEDFTRMQQIDAELMAALSASVSAGCSPDSEEGRHIAELHRQWLTFSFPLLNAELHGNMAEMYIADPRFAAYYDRSGEGCAFFLRDAVLAYWAAQ